MNKASVFMILYVYIGFYVNKSTNIPTYFIVFTCFYEFSILTICVVISCLQHFFRVFTSGKHWVNHIDHGRQYTNQGVLVCWQILRQADCGEVPASS